ncbi:MAG: hypothetical protein LBB74_06925 [Chitinispirillales bacterium]|nr:hypothetical protein [Chitinispirillales bacterium]
MAGMSFFTKRGICLAAALLVVAGTAGAQTRYVVSAGSGEGLFSVKRGSVSISAARNVSLDSAMNFIRIESNGNAVEINFNPAGGGVNIGANRINIQQLPEVVPNWGDVKLTGSVKADSGTDCAVFLSSTILLSPFNVTISGKITAENAAERCLVFSGVGVQLSMVACTLTNIRGTVVKTTERYAFPVKIVGGKFVSAHGKVLECSYGADIEGGVFESGSSTGVIDAWRDLKIVGGKFESTSGGYAVDVGGDIAVDNGEFVSRSGVVFKTRGNGEIYGSSLRTTGGGTVLHVSYGKIFVAGGTELVSYSDTNATIRLSGGSVQLADAYVTNNHRSGRAVSITSASSKLALVGRYSSYVKGAIASRFAGAISVNSDFRPTDDGYTLEPIGGACALNAVAVAGGGAYIADFKYDNRYYELGTNGGNVIVRLKSGVDEPVYAVIGDTVTGFFAYGNRVGGTKIGYSANVNDVLDSIRILADGRPCNIEFGTDTSAVDVGGKYRIKFASAATGAQWGLVTLKGMMSGVRQVRQDVNYALLVEDGVSVSSELDNPCDAGRGLSVSVNVGSEFIHSGGDLCGQINNNGGTVTVAGGIVLRIHNAGSGSLYVVGGAVGSDTLNGYAIMNAASSGTVSISGDATIASADISVSGGTVVSNGALEITGGTITANDGYAVVTNGAEGAVISGDAMITTEGPDGAVYIGPNAYLYLYGGTVASLAVDNRAKAIDAYHGGNSGFAGRLEMCGSPAVNGMISLPGRDGFPIKISTGNGYIFNPPRNEIYRVAMSASDSGVAVKNGAGFFYNFALDTAGNAGLKLAVNGNDIVAAGRTWKVAFSLNGSLSNTRRPDSMLVIRGGTIGDLAEPPTDDYISKDGFYNDGMWYIRTEISADGDKMNQQFIFGVGDDGTPVGKDEVLTLNWTNVSAISILESTRDLPPSRNSETAAIAPVVAVSGSFTAGPSPVSSSSGAVNFYRSGVALKSGKLFIYDASGNMVTTVIVNDNHGNTNRRPVARWNLQDAKGRKAAEGTYVARGVVTAKTGKTERVSVLINVRK